jgi:hypothetical protein
MEPISQTVSKKVPETRPELGSYSPLFTITENKRFKAVGFAKAKRKNWNKI